MPSIGRDDVIVRIETMFSERHNSGSYNPKIFKVYDELMYQMNEKAYDPGLVAIGPIHHNKDHVQDMEKLKVAYLCEFLRWRDEPVERYVMKLRELEGRARNCYSNFIQLPDSDRFVEMLLLDGFFVIMFSIKLALADLRSKNDYIFYSGQALKRVLLDLLLVENQLPFFILSELFDMAKLGHPEDNLKLLVRSLCRLLPWEKDVDSLKIDDQNVGHDHLLGMVYGAYFSTETATQRNNWHGPNLHGINSASELEDSGIQLKKAIGADMDVSFTSGVMQLSHLSVSNFTEIILRNLIAYEQMLPDNNGPRYVSEYSTLMSDLVKSSKDVEILRKAGILENYVGDNRILCDMFNLLEKHVIIFPHNFRYLEVFDTVNKYCNRRRNRWMATLRRDYFNSPWSILSVIASVILLLLTALQTGFTIFPSAW